MQGYKHGVKNQQNNVQKISLIYLKDTIWIP